MAPGWGDKSADAGCRSIDKKSLGACRSGIISCASSMPAQRLQTRQYAMGAKSKSLDRVKMTDR
jgi:hypothetical protein